MDATMHIVTLDFPHACTGNVGSHLDCIVVACAKLTFIDVNAIDIVGG